MILLQSPSNYLLEILSNRIQTHDIFWIKELHFESSSSRLRSLRGKKSIEEMRQAGESRKGRKLVLEKESNLIASGFSLTMFGIREESTSPATSVSLPTPPPESVFIGGLPRGALEAIKAAYGVVVQFLKMALISVKTNLSKLPQDEENRKALLAKIASIREVVLGAPLRVVLKHLAAGTLSPDVDKLIALVHRPKESFFVVPRAEKVTVVFPMRFKDSVDTVLATSFLQEFVEARLAAGLNTAPSCLWAPSPPPELNDVPTESLSVNAGYVTFVILPRHVGGKNLTELFGIYQHFTHTLKQSSEGFMHTRMRRRVESLIQAQDRAKLDSENAKKSAQSRSFKRLSLKDTRE